MTSRNKDEAVPRWFCENCSVRTKIMSTEREIDTLREDHMTLAGSVRGIYKKIDKFQIGMILGLVAIVGELVLLLFRSPNEAAIAKEIAKTVVEALKK